MSAFVSPIHISDYPTTPPPPLPIDVVIPYNTSDQSIVREAVHSILLQTHCIPIIHLVADNCPTWYFPTDYEPLKHSGFAPHAKQQVGHIVLYHYRTTSNIGPYNITNALVSHLQSNLIALQDADDLSMSSRLWKQIAQIHLGYEATSCAMQQEAKDGYAGNRHLKNPILYPGEQAVGCPGGRLINSTRTMRKDLFITINGFKNMPCSGDFQFDNRCTLILPPRKLHGSFEVLAIRRLRPESLSNGGPLRFETKARNDVAYTLIEDIQSLRYNPSISQARKLGSLAAPNPATPEYPLPARACDTGQSG